MLICVKFVYDVHGAGGAALAITNFFWELQKQQQQSTCRLLLVLQVPSRSSGIRLSQPLNYFRLVMP